MKLFRMIYFTSMAALLFTARLTGRREFFLLFFMMLFVTLFALFLNVWTVLSFSYVQELEETTTVKGMAPRIHLGIYNDKPFPFTLMKIHVETISPSENNTLRFNLSPKSSIRFDLPLHCVYRGEYNIGMTTVEVHDIFGLFHITYDMRLLPYYRQKKLTVYPRLITIPFLPAGTRDAKLISGGIRKGFEAGESYAGLRQYRPGDALKRVHWPASARQREILIRNYDSPMETAALIAIDVSVQNLEGEDTLRYADLACECAAAIAYYCLHMGYTVKLMDSDPEHPVLEEQGQGAFQYLYDWLAVLSFGGESSLSARIRTETVSLAGLRAVYVLTHRQNDALDETLNELARGGLSVQCFFLGPREAPSFDRSRIPGIPCETVFFGENISEVLGGML